MRLLHFADLHLGIEQYGTVDSETGLPSRLLDVLKTLDQMVDHALDGGVDLAVFCGDAYRTRDPSQTQQRELAKRIKRLSDAGLPVFMLVGNHDLPNSPGRANTLEIFHTLGVRNVHVASQPGIHRVETRKGLIQIAALPWLRRSGLLSREESRGMTIDQMVQRLEAVLTSTISAMASSLDRSLPAILAAHVSVSAAKTGSEKSMTLGREPVLLPGSLALPSFDYVALGHVHRAQVVYRTPPAAYSGSLERVDFGEADDDKGFYIVDIDPRLPQGNRCTNFRFQPVSARKFISIEVDIADDDSDPTETVMAAVAARSAELKGAVVRLEVNYAVQTDGKLQEPMVRQALREASYITIANNINRQARTRLGGRSVEQLTPLQALELYLDSKNVAAARKHLLLQHAEKLLQD